MPIWPVAPADLPRWISERMAAVGLAGVADAVALMAERLEGNLLAAAAQEIEKLRLLHGDKQITASMIADTVFDNARYDAFRLVNVALSGDGSEAQSEHCAGSGGEEVQPPMLLWAVAREVRLLADLKRDVAAGTSIDRAMQQKGVWRNRQGLVRTALNRLSGRELAEMQTLSFQVDGSSKGFLLGEP